MLKRILYTGSLALLAVGLGAPASAQNTPVFFEPYGEIFSARTILRSPADSRPGDARHNQGSRLEEPRQRIAIQGGVVDTNFYFLGGGGVAYANTQNARHPWQVSFFGNHLSFDGFDEDFHFFDVTGKLVAWQPNRRDLPVASIVVNYQDEDNIGDFFRALLALDQRITDELYLTGNVGYANVRELGLDEDGIFAGIGATWSPRRWPRLSVSANYNFDGNTAGEDQYTISAMWAIDKTSSVQVGAGKHEKWLVNYRAKIDIR